MKIIAPLLLSTILIICSAPRVQPEAFDDANAAIDSAANAGAQEHAPVELRFARERLSEAYLAVDYKEWDKVLVLIEQSEINSELAVEKTKTAMIRNDVTELARQNEILREDFENTYGQTPDL